MKFGEWAVIDETIIDGKILCECSCGKQRMVNFNNLKLGLSTNCGHSRLKIDIIDKQFGEWKVLEYVGNNRYKCQCSCGTVKNIRKYDLKAGISKSCGHKKIIGQRFGEWEVLDYIKEGYYRCKCSCGEIKDVRGSTLTDGTSKSCGHSINKFTSLSSTSIGEVQVEEYIKHLKKWRCTCVCGNIVYKSTYELNKGYTKCNCKYKFKDLKDKVFGEWTVLEYCGNQKWKCQCSCGTVKEVNGYTLRSGESKSCGCKGHRLIDLSGQRFGKLTVVEYKKPYWKCICDCGNTTNVMSVNLRNGSTESCGCKRVLFSYGELLSVIRQLTDENNDKPFINEIAIAMSVHESTIRRYIKEYELNEHLNHSFRSKYERELANIVGNCILGDKTLLDGQELDIYIPDKRFAIEFNGTYWHSDLFKDKYYHQKKTIDCAKRGIQLLHIFEYEWLDNSKRTIIEDIIKRKLCNNYVKKVFARKTEIKNIDNKTATEFINKYHLQGSCKASISYGLFYMDELISVMTFAKTRFKNSNFDFEIVRYCNKTGYAIVGGAEKIFSHFIKDNKPISVITYSDISKFTGNVYLKLGFKVSSEGITQPGYVWTAYGKETLSRYSTQIDKLQKFKEFGDTEDEIMKNLGYYKIYNSGNLKMEWRA